MPMLFGSASPGWTSNPKVQSILMELLPEVVFIFVPSIRSISPPGLLTPSRLTGAPIWAAVTLCGLSVLVE